MSFLSRILGTERPVVPTERAEPLLATKAGMFTAADPTAAGWSGVGFGAMGLGGLGLLSNTGQPVNHLTALQATAVYACVKCLSEDIAKLPLVVRRRLRGGGYKPDTDHPLNLLFRRPNRWQTGFEMWARVVASLALRGNSYVAILRDQAGSPRRLIPLNPDRVSVFVSPAGWLYYGVSHPLIGDGVTVHQDDMLHLRNPHAMLGDGVMGLSPVAAAQEAVGLALATQQHGATLFRQGAQIAGVLHTEATLSPEAAQRIAQSWRDTYAGVQNMGKVAVLEQGLKFERLAMTNEDAQFLATRQYQTVEICRIFRVPPHKVFDLTRATFSNIENQGQDYINDALLPIGTQIEQQCEADLLFESERERLTLGFDFDAMLRGDINSRYAAYATGIASGFRSVNECRIAENLAPIEGGDVFLTPLNMAPTGTKPGQTEPAAPNTNAPAAEPKPAPEGVE